MKKCLFIIAIIVATTIISFGQYRITPSENKCPNSPTNYQLEKLNTAGNYEPVSPDGYWELTNGTPSSEGSLNALNLLVVTWTDGYDTGTIRAKYKVISNGVETTYQYAYLDIKLLSIKGKTPEAISGATSIAYGQQSSTYSIAKMKYPDGNDVNTYSWIIPAGWKINGVVSNGSPFSNQGNSITVTTNDLSSGNIQVAGENTCSWTSNSNYQTIAVSRFLGPFSITRGTTSNTFLHGDQSPVVLQSLNISGATYVWSISGGGVLQQPTNQPNVTVIPSGCGGTVTCTMSLGGQTQTSTYQLTFTAEKPGIPATVNGANAVCDANLTYSLNYLPPAATTQWSVSDNIDKISSTNTSVIVKAKAGFNGNGVISMSYLTVCGATVSRTKTAWVGKPELEAISGPSTPTQGTNQFYTATGTDLSLQNITNYVWTYRDNSCLTSDPECWYCSGGTCAGQTAKIRIGGPANQVHYLVVKAENVCGYSPTRSKGVVPQPSGGTTPPQPLIAANQVDQTLEISFVDGETSEEVSCGEYDFEIELYNFYSQRKAKAKSKGEKVHIDTKHLKEGIYIVKTKVEGLVYSEKIVISHR